ncbi:MAG: hypothetical protein M1142_03000 [Patescibacteria group bacterium]|nr:hypothetical protein [Patescibacteria group bacterium]
MASQNELVGDIDRYRSIMEGRQRINTPKTIKGFQKATSFKELDADLVVVEDSLGFTQELPDGTRQSYMEKQAQERAKGVSEAAAYGHGKIGNRRFVEVAFNFSYMGGSGGVVVGEKIRRAADLAIKENLPMVILYSSGGQRQQEGVSALREMLKVTDAINQFKQKTNQPVVSVLVGNVWGGVSASSVPMGEPVIGIAGTNFGFAGSSASGQKSLEGALTVENSSLTNREVQVIANDLVELVAYLGKYLSFFGKENLSKRWWKHESTGVDFSKKGFVTPFRTPVTLRNRSRADMPVPFKLKSSEDIYEQYRVLCLDARRPDTLYLLEHAFDGFIPLFTGRVTERNTSKGVEQYLQYPGIVAALAYIDDPRLQQRLVRMVIGNQPSYLRQPNGLIVREHAQPTAWDFRHELKMFKFAERMGLQITSFGDTFGAKADLGNDLDAQFAAISDCLQAQLNYPLFTSGYNIHIGGSGGWMGTVCTADYVAAFAGAQEYIAAPTSAAGIIYKNPDAPKELVKATAEAMRPDAGFLYQHRFLDQVIQGPKDGVQNDPLASAFFIREDIIRCELKFGRLTTEQVLARREERMRAQRAITIGSLYGLK